MNSLRPQQEVAVETRAPEAQRTRGNKKGHLVMFWHRQGCRPEKWSIK
jgi:hypothetical protein